MRFIYDTESGNAYDKATQEWITTVEEFWTALDREPVCEDCKKVRPDARMQLCPFASEIRQEELEVFICDYCYRQRAQEI